LKKTLAEVFKIIRHAKPAILVGGPWPKRLITFEIGGALYTTQSKPPFLGQDPCTHALRQRTTRNIDMALEPEEGGKLPHGRL
jgi:hypothetical protein